MKLCFSVPGIPQAKQRARVNALLQCITCGRKTVQKTCPVCGLESNMRYLTNIGMTPKETRSYESLVAMCAQEAMAQAGMVSNGSGAVIVRAKFRFPIPKTRAKKLKDGDNHLQRPDVDNLQKSVLDGMHGVVWNDDCCVVEIQARKEWAQNGSAEIEVESLDTVDTNGA